MMVHEKPNKYIKSRSAAGGGDFVIRLVGKVQPVGTLIIGSLRYTHWHISSNTINVQTQTFTSCIYIMYIMVGHILQKHEPIYTCKIHIFTLIGYLR